MSLCSMDRSGESMNPKDKHADWLLKPTANELADYLQNKAGVELNPRLQEAATMLRQQQAEIENLEVALKNALLFIRKAQK